MSDCVTIEGLQLDCLIGVYPHEKGYPQRLYLDLELFFDNRPAAAADDLSLTLDYDAIARHLRDFAATRRVALVETLVEQMANLLLTGYPVERVRLHLHKPSAVSFARSVGVRIERERPS